MVFGCVLFGIFFDFIGVFAVVEVCCVFPGEVDMFGDGYFFAVFG